MTDQAAKAPDRATLQAAFDIALAALRGQYQCFVIEYLKDGNGQAAAVRAGYSEKTARNQASRLLTIVNIKTAIEAGQQLAAYDAVMDAREVLTRLSDVARGSMEDFMHIERVRYHPRLPVPDPTDDDPKAVRWVEDPVEVERLVIGIDLEQARDRGKLHLLKKYKEGQWGPEIELYDPLTALQLLGRHHKLFVDRAELTGQDGNPIEVSDARDRLLDRLARRAADADESGSGDPAGGSG